MKKNKIIDIFILFFKIGAFTIGGGYAMLSLIEDEIVNKKDIFYISLSKFM